MEAKDEDDYRSSDQNWDLGDDLIDLEKYTIGAYYMKMEKRECFEDASIFVVELPVSEHNKPELIAGKKKE